MTSDTTVHPFEHPDAIDDPLTTVLRDGARRLLARAIETEAEAFLAAMRGERLEDGRARVVRGSCATATARSARSRPGSARCR